MMQLKEISGLIYPWPKMFESLNNMFLDFDRYEFVKKNILRLTFGVVASILIPLVLLGYSFERFIIKPLIDVIDTFLREKDKLGQALGFTMGIMILLPLLIYALPDIIYRVISKKKSKTTPIIESQFSDDTRMENKFKLICLNSKPLGPRYSDITHKIDMTK